MSKQSTSRVFTAVAGLLLCLVCEAASPAEALVEAAATGDATTCRSLIQRGLDVNAMVDGSTALHRAVEAAQVESVELLLQAGARIDQRDQHGALPLYYAVTAYSTLFSPRGPFRQEKLQHVRSVYDRCLRMVEMLLVAGAAVDARHPKRGWTALHCAADAGHPEAVALLLEAGADPNLKATGDYPHTPLFLACRIGYDPPYYPVEDQARYAASIAEQASIERWDRQKRLRVVEVLISAGADVTERGLLDPLLMPTCLGGGTLDPSPYADRPELVACLIEAGANLKPFSPGGLSLLHLASQSGRLASARLLLEAGHPVDGPWSEPHSALHEAATPGYADQPEIIRLLVAHGIDVNVRDADRKSALDWALEYGGSAACINTLIESGAHFDVREDGQRALRLATSGFDDEASSRLVHRLLEAGVTVDAYDEEYPIDSSPSPLHGALASANWQAAASLMAAGATVEVIDDEGTTTLHLAARSADPWLVEELMRRGVSVQARAEDGCTVLHYASAATAPRLIAAGVDVNARSDDGWTPLHVAASRGDLELARLLLDAGAEVNARDTKDRRPMDLAGVFHARHLKEEMTALLRQYGGEVGAISD